MLDVGCGALRGGIHFVRYLEPGHYHGIDINESLLEAGRLELERAGVRGRDPRLLVNGRFELDKFGRRFDVVLAQSLFTHLPMDSIVRCLAAVRAVLSPDGRFFATYFEAPAKAHVDDIEHSPGGVVTHYDADPYHLSFEEIAGLAREAGLCAVRVDRWEHPRAQRMLRCTLPLPGA